MPAPDPKKMTKTELREANHFLDALQMIEYDVLTFAQHRRVVPEDWHRIAEAPSKAQVRVTLRLDEDVVRFFRAMGSGYQGRMNRVLGAWMHGRLARLIEGPDTTDFILRQERVGLPGAERPEWGETAERMGKLTARMEIAKQEGLIAEMKEMIRAAER